MPFGPGKYDDACTAARLACQAETVILIVHAGLHGDGFSVQSVDPNVARGLPAVLRIVADQIEQSLPKNR